MHINTSKIMNAAGPRVNMAVLKARYYSPEIMTAGGILSGIASAILLAKAYKRQDETLGETLAQIQDAKEQIAEGNELYLSLTPVEQEEMTQKHGLHLINKKEETLLLRGLYFQTVSDAVKLYAAPLALGGLSIALILGSRGILRKREQALFSAYLVLQQGFEAYRRRVREDLGDDVDKRYLHGLSKRNTATVEIDPETGKKKKIKGEENVIDEDLEPTMYDRIFGPDNRNWADSLSGEHFWLGVAQTMMNEELKRKGYVMLNTVYKRLGFPETPEGAVVGWSLARAQKLGVGDKYIDFGMGEPWNENRGGGALLLSFNVNGSVYEWINEPWDPEDGEL